MKYVKILFAAVLVFTMCSAFSLKKDKSNKPVYAFGVSASFTDTVVLYTNIQLLDSVTLTKEGFLPHQDLYSYQLKNYIEENGAQQNSTCMIYSSDNKSKLEKEMAKVLGKYKKLSVRRIEPDKFRFTKPEE